MSRDRLRLFVATPVVGAVQDALQAMYERRQEMERLWNPDARVRWVRPEHWHLTWVFLGEQPADRLAVFQDRLASVAAAFPPFDLALSRLDFWPRPKLPNIFVWRGVKEDLGFAEAQALYQAISQVLPGERHADFRPHITLARIKTGRLKERLLLPKTEALVTWRIDSLTLYQSILKPDGPQYRVLDRWIMPGRG